MLGELRSSTHPQSDALLDHLHFQDGLDDFRQTIERYKQDYLDWPEVEDIVSCASAWHTT